MSYIYNVCLLSVRIILTMILINQRMNLTGASAASCLVTAAPRYDGCVISLGCATPSLSLYLPVISNYAGHHTLTRHWDYNRDTRQHTQPVSLLIYLSITSQQSVNPKILDGANIKIRMRHEIMQCTVIVKCAWTMDMHIQFTDDDIAWLLLNLLISCFFLNPLYS